MRHSFEIQFWGLLMALFDVRLIRWDVLPDLLGYILLAIGLQYFAREPIFRLARAASFLMIFFSLLPLFLAGRGIGWVSWIETVALTVLVWDLCEGIRRLAWTTRNTDLMETARHRWNLYLGSLILAFLFSYLIPIPFLAVGILLFGLVVNGLIVHLIRRAGRELPI